MKYTQITERRPAPEGGLEFVVSGLVVVRRDGGLEEWRQGSAVYRLPSERDRAEKFVAAGLAKDALDYLARGYTLHEWPISPVSVGYEQKLVDLPLGAAA